MIKCRPYQFKKTYLDEKLFENQYEEVMAGYLNINGLVDGYHAEYLNVDHNLRNLDLLIVAETKIDKYCKTSSLSLVLDNWNILARYDSEDEKKHMGLILLASKSSRTKNQIKDIAYDTVKRNGFLHKR